MDHGGLDLGSTKAHSVPHWPSGTLSRGSPWLDNALDPTEEITQVSGSGPVDRAATSPNHQASLALIWVATWVD
jgi:hypothetical protein